MMTFEEMRERVMAIDLEERRLSEEKKALKKQLQEQCLHEVIVEIIFHSRICAICALEEAFGEHGYYKELTAKPLKKVESWAEFCEYRRLWPLKRVVVPDIML